MIAPSGDTSCARPGIISNLPSDPKSLVSMPVAKSPVFWDSFGVCFMIIS